MAGVRDRVALVTGCGSAAGIGFATARLLRAAGARVAITSTTERIFQRQAELGSAGTFAAMADLTDSTAVAALVGDAERALGPIDILVNNAGMVQTGHDEPLQWAQDVTEAAWRRGIDINLTSAFLTTRAALPGMLARRYGRIVNISSTTGPVNSMPQTTVYSAAKAGLLGMTRAHALEVADRGITVNAIGPGWIETASSTPEEIAAGSAAPIGRPGRPEEVGHVALFLAGEEASFVTGQLIVADGGNSIMDYKNAQ